MKTLFRTNAQWIASIVKLFAYIKIKNNWRHYIWFESPKFVKLMFTFFICFIFVNAMILTDAARIIVQQFFGHRWWRRHDNNRSRRLLMIVQCHVAQLNLTARIFRIGNRYTLLGRGVIHFWTTRFTFNFSNLAHALANHITIDFNSILEG